MKTFVCKICNHIAFDEAPVDCPVCGMAIENFENNPDAIKKPADEESLSESERKHLPRITVNGSGASDFQKDRTAVHIRIGEVEHVMESEHYIQFIDLYDDMRYVTRLMLTPRRTLPIADLYLQIKSGKLTAISHCNVHGSWMAGASLQENLQG